MFDVFENVKGCIGDWMILYDGTCIWMILS